MKLHQIVSCLVLSIASSVQATVILIDDFSSADFTISDNNGISDFNFTADAGILGGARLTGVRDSHSGALGGRVYAQVNSAASTISLWGTTGVEHHLYYGTAINRASYRGTGAGTGSDLNLSLADTFSFTIDVASNNVNAGLNISFLTDAGTATFYTGALSIGENTFTLADVPSFSEAQRSSINGIDVFSQATTAKKADGLILNSISLNTAVVPEASTTAALMGLAALGLALVRRRA